MEESKGHTCRTETGVLYITTIVNGKLTRVMVDNGASHNFVMQAKARELSLKVEESKGKIMKTVNAPSHNDVKVAKNVPI